MFYVGQKVECVGYPTRAVDKWRLTYPDAVFPSLGQILVVRAVDKWIGRTLLRFAEVNNSHLNTEMEPGFDANFFRPVVERKTDISIFTDMLKPKHVEVQS